VGSPANPALKKNKEKKTPMKKNEVEKIAPKKKKGPVKKFFF